MIGARWIEFDALTGPSPAVSPRQILIDNANIYARRVNKSGLFPNTIGRRTGALSLESQKAVDFLVRGGIQLASESMIDLGLTTAEATLSFRNAMSLVPNGEFFNGPNGSFPAQAGGASTKSLQLHEKALPLDRLCRSLIIFRKSPYYAGARKARVDELIVQLRDFAYWVAYFKYNNRRKNIDRYFDQSPFANHLLRVISVLYKCAYLLADYDVWNAAETKLQQFFDEKMSADGVFYEQRARNGVGFDGYYQLVCLQILADILILQEQGSAWHKHIKAKMLLGLRRWLPTINTMTGTSEYGLISDTGWSRQFEVSRSPGNTTYRYASSGNRVQYLHYLDMHSDLLAHDLGPAIIAKYGQRFDHQERRQTG